MRLTLRHLWQARNRRKNTDIRSGNFYDLQDGMVTIQYPHETIAIPDNGRYRLHNEMDDCIVCDKCVKVCPVDCIEIDPIRAIEEVGRASDGSPIRLYAARFDIDMAKCCYCGLCTTVCPTECLTMTKTFDYSELDVRDMVYNYSNLTPDEADEKRRLLEQFQKEKEALKAAAPKPITASEPTPSTSRPVFKPSIKPRIEEAEPTENSTSEIVPKKAFVPKRPVVTPAEPVAENNLPDNEVKTEPVKLPFRPTIKPKVAPAEAPAASEITSEPVVPKPAFRPTMKPKAESAEAHAMSEAATPEPATAKPAFRPTMKPKVAPTEASAASEVTPEPAAPKPAFRPTMKPKVAPTEASAASEVTPEPAVPKPAFRPTMKPKEAPIEAPAASEIAPEPVAPKPSFRPTMKPKPKKDE